MTRAQRGWLVAAVQLAMIASLGAKMLYDRKTRPRAWARVVPFDPNMPIRGRYVSLQMEVEVPGLRPPVDPNQNQAWWQSVATPVIFSEENHRLVAKKEEGLSEADVYRLDSNAVIFRRTWRDGELRALVRDPVLFFIPENVQDPSRRVPGEELWVEVTLPKKGPPRPIRLAVIRQDGTFRPLELN